VRREVERERGDVTSSSRAQPGGGIMEDGGDRETRWICFFGRFWWFGRLDCCLTGRRERVRLRCPVLACWLGAAERFHGAGRPPCVLFPFFEVLERKNWNGVQILKHCPPILRPFLPSHYSTFCTF
jgi:hypothetical protein